MRGDPSPAGISSVSVPAPSARLSLILLLLINLFNYVDRQILSAVVTPVQEEFGVSDTAMGWLSTAFFLVYMVASPVFGWLADRTSRWLLVGIGVALWSLASGGSGLARGYLFLLMMRCMIGFGEAAYGPVAPTLISDLYPQRVRGRVLAWFYAAIPVGSALGYAIGGGLIRHWHWAFYLTVPPGLALSAWCFLMREPERGAADPRHPAPRRARPGDYLVLARIPSYVLDCAGMTAMTFAIGGIAYWMPKYLVKTRSLDPHLAVPLFGFISAGAGLAATLAGGFVGDKLRARLPGSYFIVSAAGMIAGFPLFLLVLITPFPWAWLVITAAVFCLFFNTGPSNTILANVTPAPIRATAFALNIFIIHALGDVPSPVIIGAIADRWSLTAGFVLVSIMMLIGGLIWLAGARYLARDTELSATRLVAEAPSLPPV